MVAAAGTGSVSGIVLNLLAQALANPLPVPAPFDCPVCLDIQVTDIDIRSLALGLLIGICIGPLIDLLYGLKLIWRRAVARWWGGIVRSHPFPLYRVHE